MRKNFIWLLLAILLLTACTPQPPAAKPTGLPAEQLLQTPQYDQTAISLGNTMTPTGLACRSGDDLYFLASVKASTSSHTNAAGEIVEHDVLDQRLYHVPLTEDAKVQQLWVYPSQTEDTDRYIAPGALFPGERGSAWIMAVTTEYLFDFPEDFDETTQDKWEYYQFRGNTITFRQFSPDGSVMDSFTLTGLFSPYEAAAFCGGYLFCAFENTITVLDTDGNLVSTVTAPAPVSALTAADDSLAVLSDREEDGACLLYRLNPEDLTFSEGTPLPMPISDSGSLQEDTIYFSNRGNLFSWDLTAGQGKKLLDWQDLNRDRSHILDVFSGETVAALSQSAPGQMLELLLLTPGSAAENPEPELILGTLYPDDNTMELALQFNRRKNGGRIRVADYSEYEALGLSGVDQLRLDLAAGRVPDLLFSADWYTPITALAKNQLMDLTPYIDQDEALAAQGLIDSVFEALREPDGTLLRIASSFRLSTTVGRGDILSPVPVPTRRAVTLCQSLQSDGFPVLDPYTTQVSALQAHLSRMSGAYLAADGITQNAETFLQGLSMAKYHPKTIDWNSYTAGGIAEGWYRVRNRSQLLLPGSYSTFTQLAEDMSAVGEDAVLCGWPDTPGGHALEVWESWGMTTYCRDPELGWMFLRQVLLDENQASLRLLGLPTNHTTFHRAGRAAMQRGADSIRTVGAESISVSSKLTSAQYHAIEKAVEETTALSNPMDAALAEAVYAAVQGFFDDTMTPDDAVIAAQTAVNTYLTPDAEPVAASQ